MAHGRPYDWKLGSSGLLVMRFMGVKARNYVIISFFFGIAQDEERFAQGMKRSIDASLGSR